MIALSLICILLLDVVRLDNVTIAPATTQSSTTTELIQSESTLSSIETSTLSVETTTCSINSTDCKLNNIDLNLEPNITQTKLNSTKNNHTSKANKNKKHIYKKSSKTTCFCNLQNQFCDINCCCDSDCSYDNKQVFDTCIDEEENIYDKRFCTYMQYIYQNNTLYEWEVNQNSLFCIMKNNLPPYYYSQKKQVIKDKDDAKLQIQGKFQWPVNDDISEAVAELNKTFSYGDKILLLRNYSSIIPLELPDSFITAHCHITESVGFLRNIKRQCIQTQINEDNAFLNMKTYYDNLTVISFSQVDEMNITNFKDCPRNACIPIKTSICSNTFESCKLLEMNKTSHPKTRCYFNIHSSKNICNNLVKQVRYHIYHNGTHGIKNVSLYLILQNTEIDILHEKYELEQKFEVNFIWSNYSLNYSDYLSGNPGYVIGKPILIANLVIFSNITTNATTNTTKVNKIEYIERNHLDYTQNFMVFPQNVRSKCVLSNKSNTPIEFGYNMITKCKIVKRLSTVNLTSIKLCQQIQTTILKYWSIEITAKNNTVVKKNVGNFGNANKFKKQDWSSIIFGKNLSEVLNITFGDFTNNNKTINCGNISTHIIVDIFHSREEYNSVHNQEKIAGTFVDFSNHQKFSFHIINDTIDIEIPVVSEVIFIDVTSKKTRKYIDPPSLEIKLPYDFFYPFIKIENHSCHNMCDKMLVLVSCILVMYINLDY